MKDIVFLLGYMGAGKSSFGKRLARKMNYVFLDLDQEIENATNNSVAEIFSKEGETAFRKLETDWLKNFQGEKAIVSLGGGTPCFNNNMELVRSIGKSIYLELPPKVLLNRLKGAKTIRPLIVAYKDDTEGLLKFIEENLAERLPYYTQATYTVNGSSISAQRITELIELLKSNDAHSV